MRCRPIAVLPNKTNLGVSDRTAMKWEVFVVLKDNLPEKAGNLKNCHLLRACGYIT
jgi:hypothetical protein